MFETTNQYIYICIIIIYPTKITGMLQIPAAFQIEMAKSSLFCRGGGVGDRNCKEKPVDLAGIQP